MANNGAYQQDVIKSRVYVNPVKFTPEQKLNFSKTVSKTFYVSVNVHGKEMIANAIMAKMLLLIRDHGSMSYRELLEYFDESSDGTVRTYGCRLHRCGVLTMTKGVCKVKKGKGAYTRLSIAPGVVVGEQVELIR